MPLLSPKDSHNNNCFISLVHLAHQKQPKVDKTLDGRIIMSLVIVVIREKSKSTGIASDFQNSLLFSLFYLPYATTRKSPGEMTRKLSVIRSRKNSQFFGIVDLRNFRMARLNSRKVG